MQDSDNGKQIISSNIFDQARTFSEKSNNKKISSRYVSDSDSDSDSDVEKRKKVCN